jgi:hypothetical protein
MHGEYNVKQRTRHPVLPPITTDYTGYAPSEQTNLLHFTYMRINGKL